MRESRRSRSAWSNRESEHESISHKLKKPREFHGEFNKRHGYIVIISILLIAIILGSPAIFNSVASHTSTQQFSKADAEQPIWNDNLASGDLSGYKFLNANFFTSIGGSSIALHPTATQSAIVITNIKVDLSIASSRELFLKFGFVLGGACPANGVNPLFGFFLTRFPSSNSSRQIPFNYDPRADANVSLATEISVNNNACGAVSLALIQRNDNRTLLQDFAGGSTGGSDYLQTGQGTLNNNAGNFFNAFQLQLNYTGNAGSVNSVSGLTWDTGTTATTQIFPTLPLNQYYVGLFELPNSASFSVDFLADLAFNLANNVDCRPTAGFGNSRTCMTISWNVPAVSTPIVVPQTPDTSGFFGPLIKWIISGFVFVYQNLVGFLVWLESLLSPEIALIIAVFSFVFVSVFNAIGSIWGDSSFGNHILNFISGLVTYFVSALTSALNFLPSAVTFIVNALSIFTAFFLGGNSFVGIWTSLLSAIATAITQLNGFLATLLYFFNLGLFGMNVIFTFMTALLCLAALVDWEETENPLAGFITIVLAFFLFYVLAFGGSTISPVATNATVQANYQTAWNNVKFLVQIMPLLFFSMITQYAVDLADNPSRHRGHEFMPSFQSLLKFYIMATVDIFKGGYWFFAEGHDIVSKAISALKGRWSPVEVAGTG